ncbi:hypothetical protein HYS82_02225 [Candidatus Amesbacteria bacterium]|nr:hypothetical protein [Candidatus Amesbacteria bacterium]
MNTFILGGGSYLNKAWVDETQQNLHPEIDAWVVYWNDWEKGEDAKIDFAAETNKVVEMVGHQAFDLIAKSVGSYIGLNTIERTGNQIRKLVICGTPLEDFPFEDIEKRYQILASLRSENVICIQNEQDPHGSFVEVRDFIAKINPGVQVIKKTGEYSQTHNYPYPQDFKEILTR